jgi:hypothetical protein
MEFTPRETRGHKMMLLSLSWSFGYILMAILAWFALIVVKLLRRVRVSDASGVRLQVGTAQVLLRRPQRGLFGARELRLAQHLPADGRRLRGDVCGSVSGARVGGLSVSKRSLCSRASSRPAVERR